MWVKFLDLILIAAAKGSKVAKVDMEIIEKFQPKVEIQWLNPFSAIFTISLLTFSIIHISRWAKKAKPLESFHSETSKKKTPTKNNDRKFVSKAVAFPEFLIPERPLQKKGSSKQKEADPYEEESTNITQVESLKNLSNSSENSSYEETITNPKGTSPLPLETKKS